MLLRADAPVMGALPGKVCALPAGVPWGAAAGAVAVAAAVVAPVGAVGDGRKPLPAPAFVVAAFGQAALEEVVAGTLVVAAGPVCAKAGKAARTVAATKMRGITVMMIMSVRAADPGHKLISRAEVSQKPDMAGFDWERTQ